MIFARNITSSLYADIIVYLDNLIFRNFQDEELPPAVLRAIGWTRTLHDVEHAAVPDLTGHGSAGSSHFRGQGACVRARCAVEMRGLVRLFGALIPAVPWVPAFYSGVRCGASRLFCLVGAAPRCSAPDECAPASARHAAPHIGDGYRKLSLTPTGVPDEP